MLSDKVRSRQKTEGKPLILVIGDLMIDHYVWGDATRLSPEAPVPVVNVQKELTTLGGAANVAQNLISLGAEVILAGIIGDDNAGRELIAILEKENINSGTIITDDSRKTTFKSRILVGSYQIVRIDREMNDELSAASEKLLFDKIKPQIELADIVLLSDYNKGIFTTSLTENIISHCKAFNKKVIVDPKGLNYSKYHGAFIIKPNRKEFLEAVKLDKIASSEDLRKAAASLLSLTDISYLIVTLSEEGMAIVSKDDYRLLPVKATEVFDVTGAGDTVMAALAYFITMGLEVTEACELANYAAAIVITRVGSASTTIEEILKKVENQSNKNGY